MKTNPCRYCHGRRGGCTSCNGTGIDGNPRIGLLIVILSALLTVGGILWVLS